MNEVQLWFGRYRIMYSAFRPTAATAMRPDVEILCFVDNNDLSHPEGPHVGGIRFWESDRLPPSRARLYPATDSYAYDRVLLDLPIERLQSILYTLIHDAPLYLFFWGAGTEGFGRLGTGSEQAGTFDWENLVL